MKRILFIILAVIAVFLVIGFSFSIIATQRSERYLSPIGAPSFGFGGGVAATQAPAAIEAPAPASDAARNALEGYSSAAQPEQVRKVIKNDQLTMVVKNPEKSMKDIIALAEQMNGYVVSSNLYQSTYGPNNISVPQAQVVIRVPSEKLTDALNQIKKDAIEVQSENLTGQDVTDQYVDLQSRLSADQSAADQLRKIMQSAEKPEDVLAVFEQLRQVQSDIEVLKGQIKYIDESTATSEISATLIAEQSAQPIEVGPWKPQGAAKDAIQDLIFFFQNFVDFLIRFVLLTLPALILIAIPLYIVFLAGRAVYRRVRRSRVNMDEVKSEAVKK